VTRVDVRSPDGSKLRPVELDPAVFGIEPNVAVMHQVVTAQLAAARSGTHSTKTRAEVRGGGKKPWRQKGTGRARQGSSRAPHWSGGGVAAGPKPRDYRQRTPKKMVQLALRSALSDRASEEHVAAFALDGKVLLVLAHADEVAYRSFRNLPDVQLILAGELNAYDVLCNDWIVFTEATLMTAGPASSEATAEQPVQGTTPARAEPSQDRGGAGDSSPSPAGAPDQEVPE